MGKNRIRLKGSKGKRWAKGHSSSSNPETNKHRQSAKSRFFQENLGLSNLTADALKKHNAFIFDSPKSATCNMEMEEDVQSCTASTVKTFDTFASEWSACSNQSFSKLMNNFSPGSAIQKEMLAILAAVAEVIKEKGGNETNTEYFGALMTTLADVDLEETSIAAVLNLLTMGIKSVPQGILQSRFSQCSKIFLEVLAKYAESENNVIMKGLLSCLSVLLRAQEMSVWKEPSTKNVLNSILIFTIHNKPKVRKAAQHALTAVMKGSSVMEGENPPAQHPAGAVVAEFCVRQMEQHGVGTTTLHVLGFLKEILGTLPRNQVKTTCETILKVMTLGNVLVNSNGLQALHGLFVSRPKPSVLPPELNAKLIAALYDYQPSAIDSQPTQAWLAVMQEAFINLNNLDPTQSISNVPHLFIKLTTLWLSGHSEIFSAATLTMRALVEDVVGPASKEPQHRASVTKVIVTVQAGLKYQYHAAWTHVLHIIGAVFKACGENCTEVLYPCLEALADLRDSHQFCYTNELDYAVGQAVRSMGPEVVIKAVPLQLNSGTSHEFKRSWVLPILKENIQKSTLKCFIDQFMPLAVLCKNQAAKFAADNNQVRALSYDLMQSQLWALLPSFCSQPSDIAVTFPVIAKPLGSLLSTEKGQRLTVMAALRRLVVFARDNKREQDIAQLARFAKNFLPILFNVYTTPAKGSDEEGIRLATLEAIKVYLTIVTPDLCSELFSRALIKLDALGKDEHFVRASVLDLLRCLGIYQGVDQIEELYNRTAARLKDTCDHKEQKKYYRILEDILTSPTQGCKDFVSQNLQNIEDLLLKSLSSATAVSSLGPRLRCLKLLLPHSGSRTVSLINIVVPEAVYGCRDMNAGCRQTAYELLNTMADAMLAECGTLSSYVNMVLGGLAAANNPTVSATLLALASIVHHTQEMLPEEEKQLILGQVCLLCCSASREIVGSTLSFIKVFINSLDTQLVTASVPSIVKALISMTEDCKRHFRTKTRDILARLVRWYGADNIISLVPEKETTMLKRLRNMRKIQARKKRQWEETKEAKKNKEVEGEEDRFSVKSKPKSIDEILNELDESDLEMDVMVDDRPKLKGKKKKNDVYIREDADDIVDFTDISTTKKISSTRPDKANGMVEMRSLKKKESAFKTAQDGRMIIKDNSDSDEERQQKKPRHVPGLSESDDDDLTEARSTVSSVGPMARKRKMSTSTTASNSTRPPTKYQAGGIGIHRPIKKTKPGTKSEKTSFGAEYRSKKAAGDVKKKGMPDPFAYLPLRKDSLNKRKRMKAMGQFKNILKGAKKGASIGVKNKMKMKKKKK